MCPEQTVAHVSGRSLPETSKNVQKSLKDNRLSP